MEKINKPNGLDKKPRKRDEKASLKNQGNMNDIDETQLEDRGQVHFKNGATYTGQWLGNMKHGYG